MKNILGLLIFVIIIYGCKEQTAKLLFDNVNDISNLTEYFYKYDSNRKISETEIYYTLLCGLPVDTMITNKTYFYNSKNLLYKEETKIDNDVKPSIRYYDYDSSDSLISDLTIESNGDTSYYYKYEYFPDGRNTVYERRVELKIDPNKEFSEAIKEYKKDTIISRYEYTYVNNKCKYSKQYDKNNRLISIKENEYKRGGLYRVTSYNILDSIKILDNIIYYNYSKSDFKPDYCTLNSRNDTVDRSIKEFINGKISSTFLYMNSGEFISKTKYKNGKEDKTIIIFSKNKTMELNSNYYYKNGDIKEISSSRKKINAH